MLHVRVCVCVQPFWPTGSGCARGFLGALDAAWMIRAWASGTMTPLEVMAERESVYQLLSQTTPENVNKNFSTWTVDPNTRSVFALELDDLVVNFPPRCPSEFICILINS